MEPTSQGAAEPYPVQFSVEYPDRQLNRLTTAFRVIVAIPILIVAATVEGHTQSYGGAEHGETIVIGAGGIIILAPLLLIVFRQKYPRWWFDWNLELLRFSNRVGVYLALMDDRYRPPTSTSRSRSTFPIQTSRRN